MTTTGHETLGRLSSASPLRARDVMLLRLTAVCLGLLVCEGGVPAAGQSVILDADRYIKIGTRIPELPAGEGGELHIDAPHELCRDAKYLLDVRFFSDDPPQMMPVVRLTAGPSACTWVFERMPVGRYEALMLLPRDERIVATGRGSLSTGTTTVLTLEPAETEVEGRLTSAEPLPSPLRLKFAVHGRNNWMARVAPDGSYHVTLGDVEEGTLLTILAEPDGPPGSEATSALNTVALATTTIRRGLVRIDLHDVKLPPMVVHVEVPPIADAGYGEFAEAMVDDQRGGGFKLLRGFRFQFLATYGEHTVKIWTNDRQHLLAMRAVVVSPPETESRVVLEIPRRY
jgi:hypothetical protein